MEALGCPEFGRVEKLTSRWCARRRCRLVRFELERCQHTERRVSALTIVEDLEVFEECGRQLQASRPDLTVQELDMDAAPERLHQGVDAPMVCQAAGTDRAVSVGVPETRIL